MSKPRTRRKLSSQPSLNRIRSRANRQARQNGRTRAALLLLALILGSGALLLRSQLLSNVASAQTSTQRINSGGGAYLDSQGQQWSADNFSQNGSTYTTPSTADILNTVDDTLYRTERYGGAPGTAPLQYSFPVANGTYTVRLHFAEIWHGVGGNGGGIGSRVFNVSIEGTQVLTNYDIYQKAGGALKAVVEPFQVNVADGFLDISFAASVDNAKVSAIEVLPGNVPQPTPTPMPTPTSTLNWTVAAPLPVARYESPAAVAGGKVYVLGGFITNSLQATARMDIYDPGSNTWSRGTDLPVPLTHHGVAVDDQTIWIAGGFQGDFPGVCISNVWKYDVASGVWTAGPQLPGARAGGVLVKLGRELHFLGGTLADRHTDAADHWVLNLDNPVGWNSSTPMTSGRVHMSGAVVNGKIYLIGGGRDHDNFVDVNTMESYDPATGQWTTLQSLALARSHFEPGTSVVNERIIIAGGKGLSADQLANVSEYNPGTNTWRELTPLPEALRAVVGQVVGNVIITTGGGNQTGTNPQTTTRTATLADPPQLSPQASFAIAPPDNGANESGLNASTYNSGSFRITNNSTAGEKIKHVRIDLREAIFPDMVFDPFGTGGDPVGKSFTVDSDPGVGLFNPQFSGAHNGGYDVLDIDFNNFDPGETLTFSLDVDPNSIKGTTNNDGPSLSGKVSGLELTGARVTVEFNNGEVRVADTYRIPSSLSQSQNSYKAYPPPQPVVSVQGVSAPAKVATASQTVRVSAPAGSTVSLLIVEGGLYTDAGSGGGAGLPAFYANKAIGVSEQTATVGAAGFVDIPVTLTRSDTTGGINYITAVTKDASGRTSLTSAVLVLEFDPNANPNPTPTPTPTPTPAAGAFQEQGGQVVMEAEHFDQQISRGGQSWTQVSDFAGYSDAGAMLSAPNNGTQIDTGYTTTATELQYKVNFTTTGTYQVWLRAEADNAQDNSVHAGLDGQAVASADRMTLPTFNSWQWTKSTSDGPAATVNVTSAGVHTLNIWMREDGMRIDRVLLTTNATQTPSGIGPAESARSGNNSPPQAPTGLTATPGFNTISLDWDDTFGATGYNVYRSTSNTVNTSGTPLNGSTPVTASAFTDTSVSQAATYYYAVVAVNSAGASPPSATVSAKPSGALPSCGVSTNPTLLTFSGAVADTYAGSGFNCYMPGTVAPDAASTGLTLSGFNSQLTVASTDGDIYQNVTGQTNALALKFANTGSYSVRTRIKGPFAPSGDFQAAGVALALDSNNYAKLVVGYGNGVSRLQFGVETNGTFANAATEVPFDLLDLDSKTEALDLWLVRKSDGTIEALYRKVTNLTSSPVLGAIISMGTTASAPAWSSSSSQLYGGLLTTDTGAFGSFNTVFDEFELGAAVAASGPSPVISFSNKTILKSGTSSGTALGVNGFANPTSLELGPDGRLYVATQLGQIYIVTLDPAKLTASGQMPVVGTPQVLSEIANKSTRTCTTTNNQTTCQVQPGTPTGRQVTGLVIGPESTSSNIVLYVSHSDPRIGKDNDSVALSIDTYSGTITKLTLQLDTTTADPNDFKVIGNQDLVTGLPRSRENHSVNGMDFGPDGWLYLAIGGNTNYGQQSTFFSNLPEYYLSAAVVRINLAALGTTLPLNVQNVKTAADLVPLQGKFELYATGFRNAYDLVWHSNGNLYLNDNAGNDALGNTPNSSDNCSTPSINPGSLPDTFHIVKQNSYGGHPNPARGQCVLNDGKSYNPDLVPEPNYLAPLTSYPNGASTNGIVEYKSNAFGGQMKGNLISATYAGDQNVRRVILSGDGQSVAGPPITLGGYGAPLDVTTDTAGIIYVAEHGTNQITLLIPNQAATCPDASSTDDDGDGYSDTDEATHGTDPCSAASKPPDFDGDFVGDLTDTDDDGDGIPDVTDQLFYDAQNGANTTVPLAFEWNPGDPPPGKFMNTGFTGVQIATNGTRTDTSSTSIRVGAAGGFMSVQTFSGTAEGSANSQVNALQVGFDSSQPFRIWSEIVEPFNTVTPGIGHMGGIFFGPNQDNFIRLALRGDAGGNQFLQLGLEQNGVFAEQFTANLTTAKIIKLDVYLVGNPTAGTVTAFYTVTYDQTSPGSPVQLGSPVPVPSAWFSNNANAAKNTSLAGIMVSHGNATPLSFAFDYFRIDRNLTSNLPAPTGLTAQGGNAQVALSWNAVSGSSGYKVYRSTTSPVAVTASNLLNGGNAVFGTSYTDTSVTNGTTYYYVVTAVGGASGESPASNQASATPAAPQLTQQRINSGGGAYLDSQGQQWSADNFSQNGSTYTTSSTADILNTVDDTLYRTERYGGAPGTPALKYSIPMTNGTYTVRLHFAEIWHGVGGNGGGIGSRVFNVSIEGTQVLTNYDIYQKAGGALKAVVEPFQVNVADGFLDISFAASVDNAKVSAIEVLPGNVPQPTPTPTPTPTPSASPAFIEQGGQVVMEAEKYTQLIARGGKTWSPTNTPAGFVGQSAMFSGPNTGAQVDTNYTTTTPEMQYRIKFSTPGTYYVWLRAQAGSQQDNAAHVGLNGQAVASADRMTVSPNGSWVWTKSTMDGPVATINIPSAGVYTLNVWMREDGLKIDRLLLTTNASYVPPGSGPAESLFASNLTQGFETDPFSTSMTTAMTGRETTRPDALPALFESELIKTMYAVAWNRNQRLFPATTKQ